MTDLSLCAALAVYQDQPILLRILSYRIIVEYTWTRTEETGLRIPSKLTLAPRDEASGPAQVKSSQVYFITHHQQMYTKLI